MAILDKPTNCLLNASFEPHIENPKEKSGTALDHEMPPFRFSDGEGVRDG
jgi:hypothetical protein